MAESIQPVVVQPEGWARPRGYSNGMIARGRVLAIAGQIGWNEAQSFEKHDFVGQFDQALANVVAVVRAAGGRPEHIIELTTFVTDVAAYRASARALGPVWRRHMGKHFPAMALLGVTALVEPEARVEIKGLAILPEG